MDPQTIALLIGAGGLGGMLTALLKGLQDWRSGEHQREKERNLDAMAQRDSAYIERDKALEYADEQAAERRRMAEHASELRRLLIEDGRDLKDIPPFPSRGGSKETR